jgi:Raf kinase inhibitor-like YbhB/YbcL family protein
MLLERIANLSAYLALIVVLAASASTLAADRGPLVLSSSAFASGATIARQYTCDSADNSPPLTWDGVPDGTKSFALILADPDAPSGNFIHWVVYNLPAAARSLPEALQKTKSIASGGAQGINSFGRIGYNGPCPPRGPAHHYHFKLYALDAALDLKSAASAAAVEAGVKGHVLATAELVGTFGR